MDLTAPWEPMILFLGRQYLSFWGVTFLVSALLLLESSRNLVYCFWAANSEVLLLPPVSGMCFYSTTWYLKGPCRKNKEELFIREWSDRMKDNGLKLKESRSRLDIKKKFFTMRVVRHWNRWGFEQAGLVDGVLAHVRGVGTRWSIRSLPTRIVLWFCNSMIWYVFIPGWIAAHIYFPRRVHEQPVYIVFSGKMQLLPLLLKPVCCAI